MNEDPGLPIFWSFRRCPYAMRARLALRSAGVSVALREIVLRDKPAAFIDTSASGTVPALRSGALVIDESLDIMIWALKQRDPDHLLSMPEEAWDLINQNDGPFKAALDRTKYATRYPDADPLAARARAAGYLSDLEARYLAQGWLFGSRASLADYAILPFLRQFAFIDKAWFDAQPWPKLQGWLALFLASAAFEDIMHKYPPWSEGDPITVFPSRHEVGS